MHATNVLPWFALYVKPKHEKHIARSLESKGYEAFLPTYTKTHENSKRYELPLFPSYVFCRLDVTRVLPVVTTHGVFSLVGNGHRPQEIPEGEIDSVKQMLASGYTARPWPYIAPGQEICLEAGPLRGLNGIVVDTTHDRWVVISVQLLQRSIAVKVDRASVVSHHHPQRGRVSVLPLRNVGTTKHV
jgi:transcriptional antiterminator NusG